MGFDLYGIQPKITGKKPEILETSFFDLDETNRKEYYDTLNEWETSNPGIYFRNNVWWWRPLWHYVCEHCDLSEKAKKSGNYNDGYLIDKDTAIHIADTLERLIVSGHTKKYEQSYVKDTAPKRNFNKGL